MVLYGVRRVYKWILLGSWKYYDSDYDYAFINFVLRELLRVLVP